MPAFTTGRVFGYVLQLGARWQKPPKFKDNDSSFSRPISRLGDKVIMLSRPLPVVELQTSPFKPIRTYRMTSTNVDCRHHTDIHTSSGS